MEHERNLGRFRFFYGTRPFMSGGIPYFFDIDRADDGKPPTYTPILRLPRPRRAVVLEEQTLTGFFTTGWIPRGPDPWRRVILDFLWGVFGKRPPF